MIQIVPVRHNEKTMKQLHELSEKLRSRMPGNYRWQQWGVEFVGDGIVTVRVLAHDGDQIYFQEPIKSFPSDVLVGQMLMVL